MATQDVLTAAITQLQTLAAPSANAAQIASLQTQIATLQSELAAATAQLATLQGGDGVVAQKVLAALTNMIPNRVPEARPLMAAAVAAANTANASVVGVQPAVANS